MNKDLKIVNTNVPAREIIEFRNSRNWQASHTPANLIKSISVEAAELLEVCQFQEENLNLDKIKEELADVLIYSITLAEKLNLNINEIILDKIKVNDKKHPKNINT